MEFKILIFIFHLYCMVYSKQLENGSPNTEGNAKEIENIFEEAQIAIANSFEKKIQKFKAEELPVLTLSERILPMEFSVDSSSLSKFEVFRVVQWSRGSLLVAAGRNETCIFTVTFSGEEVFLDEAVRSNHLNFLKDIDFLNVLTDEGNVWIFETSSEARMVLITKVSLDEVNTQQHALHQILPLHNGFISGVHSFFHENRPTLIVTSVKNSLKADDQGRIELFSFKGGFLRISFDEALPCNTHKVDIASFVFKGSTYVIFRCNKNVVVSLYDSKARTMKEIQKLSNEAQNSVIFKDEISEKLFLILVKEGNAEIFWFKNKFLKMREFLTESETQYGASFNLLFRNFLVFGNQGNISLYDQNLEGNFKSLWHYSTSCENTSEIFSIPEEERVVFVLYCQTSSGQDVRFTQLKFHYSTSEMQMDSPSEDEVEKCLDELETTLKRQQLRIDNFLKVISEGLILTSNKDQVLSQPVSFKSLEVKGEIQGKNLALQPPEEFIAMTSRINELSTKVMSLGNKMKTLESQLPTLMTFETDQHISASIRVPKMIANDSNILLIDLEELNGIPYNDYKTKFLLLDEDQLVTTNVYFDKVMTMNINTKMLTNNITAILPQDLLDSKKGDQIVTGSHSFSSIEVRHGIDRLNPLLPMEINNIKSDDIVTSFSDVMFERRLSFSKPLIAKKRINIGYLNGVDYDVWRNSVIRINNDSSLSFGGSLVVDGNVRVKGNVKVAAVNGINVRDLYDNSVKKSSSFQIVKGPVEFTDTLKVGNMEVKRVNDADWKDYLRLTNTKVEANFNIDEGIVLGDVNSDSVNGLDLDKEVLISGTDQIITGEITFASDVAVSGSEGVTMEMGATINGFDPSLHSLVHPDFNQEVINYKLNFGEVLQVNHDIRVTKINDKIFPNLEYDYWRKSSPQRIPVNVQIQKGSFKKSLYASSFNGFKVDDYLFNDVEQTLTSQNFFMSDVFVHGDIDIEDGRKLNGVALSSLRDSAVTLHGSQAIFGSKEFLERVQIEKLVVKDGALKNIAEELFGNSSLYPGRLVFKGPITVEVLHVGGNLEVEAINGKEAKDILYEKPNSISEIKGNVFLDNLSVDDLTVTRNLNGENFNDWLKRTVSKTNSTLHFPNRVFVKGDVTFTGTLDVEKMNSQPFESYLSEIGQDCDGCTISGKKVFLKPVEVLGDLEAEYINGISLIELKERLLSKTKEQNVKGIYNFNGGITAVTVETPEISGLPVNEIVLTNTPSEIGGRATFKSDIIFSRIKSESLIDGCNLEEALNPPLIHVGNLVTSNVSLGRLKIEGNVTMGGKLLSGPKKIDVLKFLRGVVRKSEDQEVLGPVVFREPILINFLVTKYINNYPVEEFLQKLSTTYTNVHTECDVEFKELLVNNVITGDVTPADLLVNNQSLKVISDFGVRKNSQKVITGEKEFLGARIAGNLQVARIGNLLFENIVKLGDKHFGQKLIFFKPIFIAGDLQIDGLIAKTDPEVLFKPFINTKMYSSLFPPKYDLVIVEGDLIVNSINGLRLDDVVLTSSKSQVITGRKTISGGIFVDGKSRIDTVNGISLDRFWKLSDLIPFAESDRYVRSLFNWETSESKRTLLERTALRLKNLNSLNFEHAKGLHTKLLYITKEDEVLLFGALRVTTFQVSNIKKIYVIARYDECLSWSSCPCLETRTFKINADSKLQEKGDYLGGQSIPVTFTEFENHLYNFYVWCSGQIQTMISHFQYEKGTETLITTQNRNLGFVEQLLPLYSNQKAYFVLLSKTFEKDDFYLKVLGQHFNVLWEEKLNIRATNFDLKRICNVWYLLVIGQKVEDYSEYFYKSETRLYAWNNFLEQFVFYGTFPPATTGEMVTFGDEAFLVLGHDEYPYRECSKSYEGGDLKVYRSVKGALFDPFSSLRVYGIISTTTFIVGRDLFLVSASKTEHSLTVFRLLRYEGFEKVGSFAIKEPTAVRYQEENGIHYLVVASQKKFLTLLRLHIK